MPNEIESFDDLFSDLDIEDTRPIPKEEQDLLDDTPEIIVPDSEEDFIKSQGLKEDEEDETPEEDDKPEQTEDEEDGSDYFKTVGEGLLKLGKFAGDLPADFKWNQENFLKFYDNFTRQKAQADIEDILTDGYGDEGLSLFDAIFVKKVPIKEYLSLYADEQDYSSVDLEKVGNQKLVVKAYLEEMGVDEDEIYEQIESLEENDKLKDRAERYRSKMIEAKNAERQNMEAQSKSYQDQILRSERERAESLSKVISEAVSKKEINGIPLSLEDNKQLLPYMTAPAYKTANGQNVTQMEKDLYELRKDPAKWVALGKLLKEGLNVTPIKDKGADENKEKIFNFTSKKKTPEKTEIEDQLDLLFKRKRK